MKIIIKVGTSSLTNEDGTINLKIIKEIALSIKELMDNNNNVILVTSGAVGCGKSILKNNKILLKNSEICNKNNYTSIEKTLLSGIGQHKLLSYYLNEFENLGILTEQVLIAGKRDLENSTLIDNLNLCFDLGIVPIINANDTVYDNELVEDIQKRFSDNDILASELACKINADLLILVTNVNGYLDKNGNVISKIDYNLLDEFISNTDKNVSNGGTGGMNSKLKACKNANCESNIIHNSQIKNIYKILNGVNIGTKITKM